MTTSRVIRGTRTKIFLYICAILIITGIIACYNNTLSHLDNVKKSNDLCHQNEENLSTQLQVISDYKQRLEKSLKTEQVDHQQIKANLDNQLKEERNKYEKESNDMKLKLGSLQQHFNLLQTQYDDYKEETDKTQKQQQEEINNLEARISELLDEQKKIKSSKDKLKAQCEQIESDREKLELQVQEYQQKKDNNEEFNQIKKENADIKLELLHLKEKCTPLDNLSEQKLSQNDVDSLNNDKQEPVLAEPKNDNLKIGSSSSTTPNKVGPKPSPAHIGQIRPMVSPTVTPETLLSENKLPQGVVAIPEKKEDEIVNARYQNARENAQIDVSQPKKPKDVKDEENKEDAAQEIFGESLVIPDGIQFGDNDQPKQAEKPNSEKRHIDIMGHEHKNDQDQEEYKFNDVQQEENDDDDADGYQDPMARHKEQVVRN